MTKISYEARIRNKDLMSFSDTAEFLLLCPDCQSRITKDHLVEGYDTLVVCPSCGLRIYIG
jgi:DNA-directed RNA polymerase subunit RPC12/RpoP